MKSMSLEVTFPPLFGLAVVSMPAFEDERGFFSELYHVEKLRPLWRQGVPFPERWVQMNHSRSRAGVLRGLHYQLPPQPQGKWVMALTGKIWDVAVDVRKDSPTCGKWHAEELEGSKAFWIPPGFAHGFLALEACDVVYLCDGLYSKATETGIRYDDPELGISWPSVGAGVPPSVAASITVSTKDQSLPNWKDAQLF